MDTTLEHVMALVKKLTDGRPGEAELLFEIETAVDDLSARAYDDGYEDGHGAGYDKGDDDGYTAAKDEG